MSDGKSRYTGIAYDSTGTSFAYTTTERNGVDCDIHIRKADGSIDIVQEGQGVGWSVDDRHPNGEKVLVSGFVSTVEQQLYEIDLHTLTRRQLLSDKGKIAIGSAKYSSDGSDVYLNTDLNGEFRSLYSLDLATNELSKIVPDIGWDVTGMRLSHARDLIAYIVNVGGYGELHLLNLDSGETRQLKLPGRGTVGGVRFTPERPSLIAYTFNSAKTPSDVYVLDTETDSITPVDQIGVGSDGIQNSR